LVSILQVIQRFCYYLLFHLVKQFRFFGLTNIKIAKVLNYFLQDLMESFVFRHSQKRNSIISLNQRLIQVFWIFIGKTIIQIIATQRFIIDRDETF